MNASLPMRKGGAPSSTLLKFLRAQKDGYPFFNPSHRASPARRAAADLHPRRTFPPLPSAGNQVSNRCMTTLAPAYTVESSLFSLLNSIWSGQKRQLQQHEHTPEHSTSFSTSYPLRYTVVPPDVQTSHTASRHPYTHTRKASSYATSQHDDRHSKTWQKFWWLGRKRNRPKQPLQPDDLPRISGFLDDSASLGRILRPANELRLRCTEFDENGKVTLVNGEFKKSELIAKYGLLPRDLRKIDSSLLPSILVRPSAILINLLHLRVLIKHNRVLVFDAYGSTDSYTQSLFMYDLEGKLRNPEGAATRTATPSIGALPYEFRALESVLISVTSGLEGEFDGVREPVVRVLRELEEDIDRDKLRHLLIYSKKLGTFEQKARLVRDAIDDLLEADDDLSAMYLTEKAEAEAAAVSAGSSATANIKSPRGEDDHTEVEMLLESYHKVCDEIVQVSGNLVSNIRNTEEIVKAILDANRNSLMLLDLKFSIGTLGLAGGTFVAALYGMNLKNFIEESDLGFWGVSAWCTVFSFFVCIYGLRKLRRVQRVSMWGSSREDGVGIFGGADGRAIRGRAGWAQLDNEAAAAATAAAAGGAPPLPPVLGGALADDLGGGGVGEGGAGSGSGGDKNKHAHAHAHQGNWPQPKGAATPGKWKKQRYG